MKKEDYARFESLTFEDFRQLASDSRLSRYEKIGFPDAYRDGKEADIFADIARKLTNLNRLRQTVVDIGPGCSELPAMLVEMCRAQEHTLLLVDSAEMLAQLPDAPFLRKLPGQYPEECSDALREYDDRVDVLLTYSVFHYVFADQNPFEFLDRSLELLAPGGQMLIGDIPNVSKRKRFFRSAAGVAFHQAFAETSAAPDVQFNRLEPGRIDDGVLFGLLWRCRSAGYDAYVLPQGDRLPMANRREDLLIVRP